MHVLITGASGFLGSVCAEILAQQQGVRFSALRSGSPRGLHLREVQAFSAPAKLSGEALHEVLKGTPFTHVLHIGALSSPEACEREPRLAHKANVAFTGMVVDYARTIGAHMTTVSTDLVFDGLKAPAGGLCETELPHPISVYGRTKQAAEEVTLASPKNAVVRIALLFGRSPGESKGVLGWMERAFIEGNPLPLFKDEYRTPIHVREAALAIIQTAHRNLNGLWHCGGPERVSRVEFGIRIAKAFGFDETLIEPRTRLSHSPLPQRPEDVSLCSEKLWRELGWRPTQIRDSLRRFDCV